MSLTLTEIINVKFNRNGYLSEEIYRMDSNNNFIFGDIYGTVAEFEIYNSDSVDFAKTLNSKGKSDLEVLSKELSARENAIFPDDTVSVDAIGGSRIIDGFNTAIERCKKMKTKH